MAAELLRRILASHVLNPTPVGEEMKNYYVPFDDLLGKSVAEQPVRAAMEAGRRLAVVGLSGTGKSSLIEWVLGAPGDAFAAIRIPVSIEPDSTVTDPSEFAQHAIRTVSKYAVAAELMDPSGRDRVLEESSDRIVRSAQETTTSQRGSVGAWFLHGEIGREVRSFLGSVDQRRSGAAIVDVLEQVIALIADGGLQPLFVIDDSDGWLQVEGVKDRRELVGGFFGPVLRMLSGLRAGLVVAVHDAYLSMEGYRQAEGFVEDSVRVPKLAAPDMLAEILARRLSLIDSELAATDVFTAAALEQLFGYYSGAAKANLRKAMQAAQRAVQLAGEQDADLVAEAFVETAVSEWS